MLRNCDNCGKEYDADKRNLKRGWGLCCSKSCAAVIREKSKNIPSILLQYPKTPDECFKPNLTNFIIEIDTASEELHSYCLMMKNPHVVILTKSIISKDEFDNEVENLIKYFNADTIKEI